MKIPAKIVLTSLRKLWIFMGKLAHMNYKSVRIWVMPNPECSHRFCISRPTAYTLHVALTSWSTSWSHSHLVTMCYRFERFTMQYVVLEKPFYWSEPLFAVLHSWQFSIWYLDVQVFFRILQWTVNNYFPSARLPETFEILYSAATFLRNTPDWTRHYGWSVDSAVWPLQGNCLVGCCIVNR